MKHDCANYRETVLGLCYVIYIDPVADVIEGFDRATDCFFGVEDYSTAAIIMFLKMGGYIAATILLPNGSLHFLLLLPVSQCSLIVSIKTTLVDALKTSYSAASNGLSKMEAILIIRVFASLCLSQK